MDSIFGETLPLTHLGLLFLALAIACGFEFVNGFHDTANAVATVIYTKALKPWRAVIWSGFCNLCGVYLGGIGVAFTIVHLLPVDLLVNIETGSGLAMVLALLLAAILWNLGTWYRGLPASSSHTLIGAILGVGLANSLLSGRPLGSGVNWHIAGEVGLSLLISPLVGFGLAALLLVLSKAVLPQPHLYEPPQGDTPPPAWIRSLLILTCTGVSFAHGSNDGQKGTGLIMLILIGLLPGPYALNLSHDRTWIDQTVQAVSQVEDLLRSRTGQAAATAGRAEGPIRSVAGQAKGSPTAALQRSTLQVSDRIPTRGGVADLPDPIRRRVSGATTAALQRELAEARALLTGKSSLSVIPKEQRWQVRTDLLEADAAVEEVERSGTVTLTAADRALLEHARAQLRGATDYSPIWVLFLVALSLGLGTMIGWKRIVVTVGEKIGKTHLSYGQGAAAELVAMATIGMADLLGMPVSTTHVLSSGVAGTMTANRSGLQLHTLKEIALAWVLTLPVAMLLSGSLFVLLRQFLR